MTHIETSRLTIRNFEPDDWRGLQALAVQQQTSEYGAYDHRWPTSEEELRGVAAWFSEGDGFLAVCLRDAGAFIGLIAINRKGGEDAAEYGLGYRFDERYHGKGYATEACRAALNHVFGELGAALVSTGTAAANEPSCRLLRRLGLRKTGESVGSFVKDADGRPIEFVGYTFCITREEWLAGQGPGASPPSASGPRM